MLNSFHKNIQFTYEVESNAKSPFIDMLLMRNHNDITTTVYRKDSNSDVYLHWDSFTKPTLNIQDQSIPLQLFS